MEGYLNACDSCNTDTSCCSNGVAESPQEFSRSPRAQMRKRLEAMGLSFTDEAGLVRQRGCSDGTNCKLLALEPELGADIRPLACKVYPYKIYWSNLSKKPTVVIALSSLCNAMTFKMQVPESFTQEVIAIIKAYFKDNENMEVDVEVSAGFQQG